MKRKGLTESIARVTIERSASFWRPKDIKWMKMAIEQARLSAEKQKRDRRCPPAVGVVVVAQDGRLLARAFRSETRDGDHAEFIALEKKLKSKNIKDATLYTTLEPCMDVRSKEKIDCAIRVANSGVHEVVIGMLDPNERVCAKGYLHLHHEGKHLRRFPPELESEIRDLNRSFIESVTIQKRQASATAPDETSSKDKKSRPFVLGYIDELTPDQVDVRGFAKHHWKKPVCPSIRWPRVTDALWYRALDERSRTIEKYRLLEVGGGEPIAAEEDLLWLDRTIDYCWRLRMEAAARVPKMWKGMRLLWPKSDPYYKRDAYVMALTNYLRLCNFELIFRLHVTQRAEFGDLFPRATRWRNREHLEDSKAEAYRDLFGHSDPFGYADIIIVDPCEVRLRVYAPYRALRRIWDRYGSRIVSDVAELDPFLYPEFIVPQSEVRLVGKPEVVTYWNMAWGPVRDEQNRDPTQREIYETNVEIQRIFADASNRRKEITATLRRIGGKKGVEDTAQTGTRK